MLLLLWYSIFLASPRLRNTCLFHYLFSSPYWQSTKFQIFSLFCPAHGWPLVAVPPVGRDLRRRQREAANASHFIFGLTQQTPPTVTTMQLHSANNQFDHSNKLTGCATSSSQLSSPARASPSTASQDQGRAAKAVTPATVIAWFVLCPPPPVRGSADFA